MISKAILAITVILAATACCCPAAEFIPAFVERTPVHLTGGYSLGRPHLSGLKLCGPAYECDSSDCYPTVVDQSVVAVGWTEQYIVAKHCPGTARIFATPDAENLKWIIVDVSTGRVYRNLSVYRFGVLQDRLNIPDIPMRDAEEIYTGGVD